MPIIQGTLKTAMYVLQDHCKYSSCETCSIRNQCFNGFVNNPADFDIMPATLVLDCVDKDVCSANILMKAEYSKRISALEEENAKLRSQLEFAIATRDALEKKLNQIDTDWRKRKEA